MISVHPVSTRASLARLIGALVTAAVVVLGPHCAEASLASLAPAAPSQSQSGTTVAGDSPATAAGSVADKAAAPDVQHHNLVFLSAADEENHGDGLLVVCVSVLISITLTATIALVRRLWILPSSETPPAPELVASSPGSRARPAPGLFGIARI